MPLERFKIKDKDVSFKIGKRNVNAVDLTDDEIQKLLKNDASLCRFFEPIKEKKKSTKDEGKNKDTGGKKESGSGTDGEGKPESSTKS